MEYTKIGFTDGAKPAINSENLNKMDDAIKAHDTRLAALAAANGTSDADGGRSRRGRIRHNS